MMLDRVYLPMQLGGAALSDVRVRFQANKTGKASFIGANAIGLKSNHPLK